MALGCHLQPGPAVLCLGQQMYSRAWYVPVNSALLGKDTVGLVAGDAMVEGNAGEFSTIQ